MRLASASGGFPLAPFDSRLFRFCASSFTNSRVTFPDSLYVALFCAFPVARHSSSWAEARAPVAAGVCSVLTISSLLFLIFGGQASALPFALAIPASSWLAYSIALVCWRWYRPPFSYFFPVYFPQTTEFTAWYATDFTLSLVTPGDAGCRSCLHHLTCRTTGVQKRRAVARLRFLSW
mgnify:CR=1 FL=1